MPAVANKLHSLFSSGRLVTAHEFSLNFNPGGVAQPGAFAQEL